MEAILFLLLVAAAIALVFILRKRAPEAVRADDDGVVRVSIADDVGLRESMGTGSAPHLKHTPRPGSAVVEVTAGDFSPLTLDTLRVSRPAPKGAAAPWTDVIAPLGAYKFGVFAAGSPLPFPLPSHLDRSDASYYRVWWSMEDIPHG